MPKRNKSEAELPAFDLRAQREARSMSQTDVGKLLHSHQTSIARWERDGNMPAIYRMAWTLHWKLEDRNHAPKAKRSAVARAAAKRVRNQPSA